jgi:hypothetical protein
MLPALKYIVFIFIKESPRYKLAHLYLTRMLSDLKYNIIDPIWEAIGLKDLTGFSVFYLPVKAYFISVEALA